MPALILRRANASRKSGEWQDEDSDVFDGECDVGRIYRVNDFPGRESWFWGVSFDLTKNKSYGYADSLDAAKAAFRAEYERWKNGGG
jgi:hypothetical protein